MSKTVIAVATADWHVHRFKNFNKDNSRLTNTLKAVSYIADVAKNYSVPVFFSGDLFHNPKEVENETMGKTLDMYNRVFERRNVHFYAISGNHDLSEKNGINYKSPSHLDSFLHFKTFHKIDGIRTLINNPFSNKSRIYLFGIPYCNNEGDIKTWVKTFRKDLPEEGTKILLIHSDMPGAVTPDGFTVKEVENIKYKLFKDFDLVLCGHIHKSQRLYKNVYMLGCPIQQTLGESNCQCGYWLVYSDYSMVFVELEEFPKFIRLAKGEKPFNKKDYFIEYQEVLVEETPEKNKFSLNNSRKKLAKHYCKLAGIKNKTKIKELINILNTVE